MPDREYMEILIVARDLASGNVSQATQRIDQALQRARSSARDAERDFSRLDQTEQELAHTADQLGLSMERSGQGFVIHRRAAQDAEAATADLGRASRTAARDVEGMARSVDSSTGSLRAHAGAARTAEQGFLGLARSIGMVAGAAVGLPVAFVGIGQAATGAVGGVVALGAALSQLSALAVALPATLAAVAGSAGALIGIAGPALSPVAQALKGSEAAQAPGAAGGAAGGGGAAQPVGTGGAPTQLQQLRITQGWQMQQLETQLHQLRMQNFQQEAQAEQAVNQARVSAVQNVIQLERQLHQLKASNAAQEAQLEASLADARASAAEEAATGGDHAAIAAGIVAQAQDNLTSFRASAQAQQQQAQDAVDQAKVQGIQQVQAAERNLQQTRMQNAQQLAALQQQIAHTQIQNQWAIEQAQASQAAQAQATAASANQLTAAQSKQAALLASMTPLQRQLYDQIVAIREEWDKLTAPGRAAFLQTAIQGATAVRRGLPTIAGVENQFSGQLSGIGTDAIRQFSDPQMDARLTGFMEQMARDTGQVGRGMVNMLVAFTNFMTAPATREFIQWMVDGVSHLGKWAKGEEAMLEQHHHLADFFQSSRGVIHDVGEILKDVALVLFHIGRAAAPTGRSLLDDLTAFMDHLARETGSKEGMKSLRDFFEKAGPDAEALGRSFVIIAGALGSLAQATQNAPPIFVWAVELLQWLSKVPDAGPLVGIAVQLGLMAKFIPGVGPALGLIVTNLGELIGGMLLTSAAEFFGLAEGATAAEVAMAGLGFAVDLALGPVGWIILLITGLVLLYEAFSHNWLGIRDKTREFWEWIVSHVKSWWHDGIFIYLTGGLSELVKLFIDNWGKIEQVFRDVWNLLGDIVHGRWSKIIDDVEQLGSDLLKAMKGIWDDLKHDAAGAWQAILNTAGKFVNDLIDVWNWVVTHVGLDGLKIGHVTWGQSGSTSPSGGSGSQPGRGTPTGRGRGGGLLPDFALGPALATGGFVPAMPGGVALVSEAGHDELVVTTDPSMMSRSLQLIMEWMQRMGLLPRYDIGGWLSGVGSDIAGGAQAAWGAAENLAGLIGSPVGWIKDHIPHIPNIPGAVGGIVKGMFDHLGSTVEHKLISAAESVIPFLGGGGSGNTSRPTVIPGQGQSVIAGRAIQIALSELGVPYRWGGDMPSTGFDCSGLMEFAYRMAGIDIPRTSEAQFAAPYPRVPAGQWIPGDLLYSQFPGDGAPPGHVVMYVGGGEVIEAPHTGANVEIAPVQWFSAPGIYVGANRPAPGPIVPRGRHAMGGWTSGRQPMLSAGGWAKAMNAMMSAPAGGYGGAMTSLGIQPGVAGGVSRTVHIDMPIYTSEVAPDADYVARTLEMRLQAVP